LRRVSIIVNRQADRLQHDGPLLRALARSSRGAEVYETRSLMQLGDAARTIAAAGADTVVLAGGDGSYSAGLTALARAFGEDRLPIVALAPGGTVSTVPRNWGMRGAAVPYMGALLDAVLSGRAGACARPTLRADDGRGERLGFIFGAGLVARFFREYYAASRRGYAGAASIVLPIFAGSFVGGALARRVLTPVACTITVDGERMPASGYSLIAASVVRDLGLHMWVTYRAAEREGHLHFIASPLGTRALGPQMPRVLAGRRLHGEGHVDVLARTVTIEFAEHDAYVLDGDLIETERVTVGSGPTVRIATLH
jgi:diacylglycerol kinase family enzyme